MRKRIFVLWFLVLASSATAQEVNELQKLFAGDATAEDVFGTSVAVSEDFLVVGAPGNDIHFGTLVEDMGAAYVFVRDANNEWVQQARLTPIDGATPAVDGGDGQLGTSVAISGTTVFAGAPGERAVYVYVEDGAGGWPHVQKIVSSGGAPGDRFGRALAVSGERLIVGAEESVYFFEYDEDDKWVEVGDFTSSAPSSAFGSAVSIDGDYAVVGAMNDEYLGANVGAAHVFVWNGTKWIYETLLRGPDLAGGYEFGHSVAVSGTTILVSASRFLLGGGAGGAGKAYLYERISGVWQLRAEFLALDEKISGEFGWSVALQDGAALVTDNYYDGPEGDTGRAYVFTRDALGDWAKSFTLEASDAQFWDGFGSWIAISGESVVVGATGDDDEGNIAGAAYTFELDLEDGAPSVPAMDGVGVLLFAGALSILGARRLRKVSPRLL
jgi:hypothetical protein